jgi:hypothetical protein
VAEKQNLIDVLKSLRPRKRIRRALVYVVFALASLGLAAEVVGAVLKLVA